MFTPFSRMQLANFASACFAAALLRKPPPPATRPGPIPKPHFFTIARYWACVMPFGRRTPGILAKEPGAGRWPDLGRCGSVMPFLLMHARIAAKRAPTAGGTVALPAAVPVPDFAALALVDALVEDEPLEELPQAASARLAITIANSAIVAESWLWLRV